ncbi:MAG: hypothetical protein ACREL2_09675 [Gemmatimonadales bacterium]
MNGFADRAGVVAADRGADAAAAGVGWGGAPRIAGTAGGRGGTAGATGLDGGAATGGANIPDGRSPVGIAGRPPAGTAPTEGRRACAGATGGAAAGAGAAGGVAAGIDCRIGAGAATVGGCAPLLETGKTAAHTLQRALTPAAGTLAGSTR